MDGFLSFLVVVAILGVALWLNKRRLAQERKANPLAPYAIRASHIWNTADPAARIKLLEASGVHSQLYLEQVLSTEWTRLPGHIQTALLKTQIVAEVEIDTLRRTGQIR
jgi:hypothetical protein